VHSSCVAVVVATDGGEPGPSSSAVRACPSGPGRIVGQMDRKPQFRYDLYLEGTDVPRWAALEEPLQPEDLLFDNRWIVTDIVPATDERIDYEAFARPVGPDEVLRPRMSYFVIKELRDGRRGSGSFATRQPLRIGMEIVLGIDTWVVREIGPRGSFDLLDGVIAVEPR